MEGSLPTPPLTIDEAKQNIALRHLEHLSHFPPSGEEPPVDPDDEAGDLFDDLKEWSNANKTQIQDAVKKGAFGGKCSDKPEIDWQIVFLAFMEAATVYLRDSEKVGEAVEAYQRGEFETALGLLNDSTAKIQEIATLWGMKFQMICDLVHDKTKKWNGPYCGAFYSQNKNAPFLGVVFKGTYFWNLADHKVNINTQVEPLAGYLYGSGVSEGVSTGLFLERGGSRAFDLILNTLAELVPLIPQAPGKSVVIHVAGHSLGGSYSNVCFTQFTAIDLPGSPVLGDLYTFGCPRIGYKDFASALKDHIGDKTGSSWRIVNSGDLISEVPPVPLVAFGPFNHVDKGYKISTSRGPVPLPSEIGTQPGPPGLWPPTKLLLGPHRAKQYYQSLLKAMSG